LKVQLDDRTTIMLRNIPKNVDPEEIKQLFGEFAIYIESLQPDYAYSYFVNFDTPSNTQLAFNYVRDQKYNGKNVQGCIKSHHNYKSVFVLPTFQHQQEYPLREGRKRGYYKSRGGRKYDQRYNNGRRGGRGGKPRNEKYNTNDQDLGEYWPPLPGNEEYKQGGYQKDFKKYSIENILEIISSMKDIIPPNWDDKNCVAISEERNEELEYFKVLPPNKNNEWIEKVTNKKRKDHVKGDYRDYNKNVDTNQTMTWTPELLEQQQEPSSFSFYSGLENFKIPKYSDVLKTALDSKNKPSDSGTDEKQTTTTNNTDDEIKEEQ